MPVVDVVIPCLNEERTIGAVVAGVLAQGVRRVVVADNGSVDRSAVVAREAGAEVVLATRRGYGSACLEALRHLAEDPPEAVLFVDGDGADRLEMLPRLILAWQVGHDLVVGSRVRGRREAGALLPQAQGGNLLATTILRWIYGGVWSDLGPMRILGWDALNTLEMDDLDFGWTVQMQARAARAGLVCAEVPVGYRRRRGGQSKVSGTLVGTFRAGVTILRVLARERAWRPTT